jgi:hypothetical protein
VVVNDVLHRLVGLVNAKPFHPGMIVGSGDSTPVVTQYAKVGALLLEWFVSVSLFVLFNIQQLW